MWRNICNSWMSHCVSNPKNDTDKYPWIYVSCEPATIGTDGAKFSSQLQNEVISKVLCIFATKPAPSPKKYSVLFYWSGNEVPKYDPEKQRLCKCRPGFGGQSILKFVLQYLSSPVEKRFLEEAFVRSYCRGIGNNKCTLIFRKKWSMTVFSCSLWGSHREPLGFAAWLLLYPFKSCWIFTCQTCAIWMPCSLALHFSRWFFSCHECSLVQRAEVLSH